MGTQELRQRIHVWIYGDIVGRWRAGKLDDRQFSRAYRLRAQLLGLPMLVPIALAGMGSWLDRHVWVELSQTLTPPT